MYIFGQTRNLFATYTQYLFNTIQFGLLIDTSGALLNVPESRMKIPQMSRSIVIIGKLLQPIIPFPLFPPRILPPNIKDHKHAKQNNTTATANVDSVSRAERRPILGQVNPRRDHRAQSPETHD
jgi:hypothetical protein